MIKKYHFFLMYFAFTTQIAFTQIAINEFGNPPDSSSILDISSSEKGVLIPRLTTTQRNSIASPTDGLMVFDKATSTFWYYDNSKWNEIRTGSKQISANDFSDEIPQDNLDLSCSVLVGEYPFNSSLRNITIAGQYGYATTSDSLFILDMNIVTQPTLLASIEILGGSKAIEVLGDLAFVTHSTNGDDFSIIDISDRSNPFVIDTYELPSNFINMTISDSYVYVMQDGTLYVFDATVPGNFLTSISVGMRSLDMSYQDGYVYVLGFQTNEIRVVDVNDINSMSVVDTLDAGPNPEHVDSRDGYLYLTDFDEETLKVINANTPNNMFYEDTISSIAMIRGLDIEGNYAFMVGGFSDPKMKIVDLTDIDNPSTNHTLDLSYGFPFGSNILGKYAVVGSSSGLNFVELMPCDSYYTGINGFSGDLFVAPVEGDDLGDHAATENIKLGSNWLSNDGDDEGLQIETDGRVKIETLEISDEYTLPTNDGSANQFLSTDGNGNLAWSTNKSAFITENGVSYAINTNDDLLFGADSLDHTSFGGEKKFFFDKSSAAFRAGSINVDDWNQDSLGFASIAIGENPKATGLNAAAFGFETIASGTTSTALGSQSIASGRSSSALGENTKASGDYSFAAGNSGQASGNYSTSMGRTNISSGINSIAIGRSNTASGNTSIALGINSIAEGDHSTAFGNNTKAPSFAETSIGLFNTSYTPNDSTAFDIDDRLFVIGNGTDINNRSDALRIYKNGNMELNGALTIDSAYTFPIVDGNENQFLTTDGSGNLTWSDFKASGNLALEDNWLSNDGDNEGIKIDDDGNIGVGIEPTSFFSVRTGTDGIEVTGASNTSGNNNIDDPGAGWQSYTAGISGVLTRIGIPFNNASGNRTITLYEGEGTSGPPLGTTVADVTGTGNFEVSFDLSNFNIPQIAGKTYTIGIDNQDRLKVNINNPYNDGTFYISGWDIQFLAYVESYTGGFRIDNNGVSINDYTLPSLDGGTGQILSTDGNGMLSWTDLPIDTDTDTDDQTIDKFELSANSLLLSLEDDGENDASVDLSSFLDNTDNQTIDILSLSGSTLQISMENDGTTKTVDLSSIDTDTDTDDQTLSFSGTTLTIDNGNSVDLSSLVPVGTIQMWPTSTPPTGWVLCTGGSISPSVYPELVAVLGGTTLPNFNGRFPLGVGNSGTTGSTTHSINTVGGEEQHVLTINEMPAHSHGLSYADRSKDGNGNEVSDLAGTGETATTQSTGGNQAHNNMPPFYTINFIIKAE